MPWVVRRPSGRLIEDSVMATRAGAWLWAYINLSTTLVVGEADERARLRRHGYRVVRVRLVEVKK